MRFSVHIRLLAASLFAGLLACAGTASAQEYPFRPIRLVVGFAAGGTTDFMARLLADGLRRPLGAAVIVETGPAPTARSAPPMWRRPSPTATRSTFTTAGVAAVYPHLRADAPYDPIRDFAAIGRVAFNSTMLVVNAAMPVNSAADLAALARQRPGRITIAITGLGSVSHLGTALFEAAAGIRLVAVPYRGAAPAMTDLLGGALDGLFGDGPTVMAHISGRADKGARRHLDAALRGVSGRADLRRAGV